MDVTFDVIDTDEGHSGGKAQTFGVGESDEQGANESGSNSDCDGGETFEAGIGALQGLANDGNDGAEVFARGEFGDDSAVSAVGGDLRGDDAGEDGIAAGGVASLNDGRGGFIAGGFDAENTHYFYLSAGC